MSWRSLWVSVALALVWTSAALWAVHESAPVPAPRYFIATQDSNEYRVIADEARVEGFCTVFIRDGVRIAAVCGQHTWSEAVESQ